MSSVHVVLIMVRIKLMYTHSLHTLPQLVVDLHVGWSNRLGANLIDRPFLHKGFPWLLHVLDTYCTVAIFPSPLCVALSHTHTHTHTQSQSHTKTILSKVQMHALNTCSLACRVDCA